ncbi:mRNA capping enzyme, putative [Ixodes scapularis]|uniref:mRNA-capping enzyme n=1 Tax=Ixodes scapularis TaxID=6945 RepID=B7PBC2_IXOSC|nr:mRNA capping enzyme, putative [Ixodes scapularis]|eukprot:XP_002407939.1 mRNA capping enzyme, putative [Ixodes scapularis]
MSDRRRRNVSDLGPPPRWLNCPRKGDLVAEKFLPFKTPLSGVYDSQVPEANRFYPSMLLASLARYKVKLGLWIDLTNTGRFYDRKEVEECGVKYLKLQCRGHGECPSVEQTQTFIQLCQNFISQNPLEVIGVHCTHGFNRTGFLIAAYLVENMSWGVEAAVQAVSVARPPGIYKGDYLLELFKRYGDMAETPPPPPRPAWCDAGSIDWISEEDDDVDDDGNALGADDGGTDSPIHTKRRKEFNKKNPTFMEGVPGIQPITTQPKLVQIQRRCQHMCHWESSGFPGSQPVSMDNSNLQMLKHKPYKVSWKADGTRYMMLIDGENEVYFVDRDNCVFQASGLWFPRRKEPGSHIQNTLVDGEMIIDKAEGKDVPRYLIYDIVRIEGQEVGKTDFNVRLICISKEICEPRKRAMKEGRIDRSKEPFGVRQKDFWDLTCTESVGTLSPSLSADTRGSTRTSLALPNERPAVNVLKWKPPHLNSVDFRLKIFKESGQGLVPKQVGQLFVGGFDQPLGSIKVTKAIKALDNKILECKWDKNQWVLLRERTDKSFPNSYSTAMGVLQSISKPVTKEILLEFIQKERWQPPHRGPPSVDSQLMPPPKMAR